MVTGYKAFNEDMTNRYGIPFIIGPTYSVSGEISFGNFGNGFHMCKNLCDVFRYFPFQELRVACVTGSGMIEVYNDEYYGYYDMYSVERIKLNYILSHRDIIELMMKNYNEYDNIKFIMTFKMSEEDLILYAKWFQNNLRILCYLLYYQRGIESVFFMNAKEQMKLARKLLN